MRTTTETKTAAMMPKRFFMNFCKPESDLPEDPEEPEEEGRDELLFCGFSFLGAACFPPL